MHSIHGQHSIKTINEAGMPTKKGIVSRIMSHNAAVFRTDFVTCNFQNNYRARIYLRKVYKGVDNELPSKVYIGAAFMNKDEKWILLDSKVGRFPIEQTSDSLEDKWKKFDF